MKQALIAFYSRTGRTRTVAHAIGRRCDAHLEDIQLVDELPGWRGYLRSALGAIQGRTPALGPLEHSIADYEIIVVGTPVWAWHVASPVRSYLLQVHESLRNVAFFCTMGGAGAERVFAELSALTQRSPIATLALTEPEVDGNHYAGKLAQFTESIAGRTHRAVLAPEPRAILRTIK